IIDKPIPSDNIPGMIEANAPPNNRILRTILIFVRKYPSNAAHNPIILIIALVTFKATSLNAGSGNSFALVYSREGSIINKEGSYTNKYGIKKPAKESLSA